ncbi:MAG TPA: ABC transporter ATP-binding protein [Bacteroidota bacterium]|nr:ABC transporter ATP-binding protein [Bacteroidota bacterium]
MAHHADVISLTGVVRVYEGGQRALDGLTFTVPAGSICGFIGLNGAGKSTTIRLISGLEEADGGLVDVLGERVPFQDPRVKRRMGFVLDDPFYFDWLSAREYLVWIGRMEGLGAAESARRTDELLDVLSLPGDEGQLIRTFSTGMKKKVSLAAAIIHAPELLILDEPLEAVDAASARYIRDVLLSLARSGSTIFLTSHALDTVQRFCTELRIIHRGRMVLACPTNQLAQAARSVLGEATEGNLEDLFLRLVTGDAEHPRLSYV